MERKRGYIFTDKKYTKKSIMSTVLGIIAMISVICAIYFTYENNGQATDNYGVVGLMIVIYSIIGWILGILARVEKEQFYLFSHIGIILNTCNIIGISYVIYMGIHY
ncbi:MAG: DUF6142 family protein [Eubacteriales bacterium]